ncbi:hypothetical protein AB0M20_27995 [Actinoplanes sp. NPDC051633]|uniref:hypothetical protein n=1 Tax=Actinoplanes sp. NPDC051633 TaxID=3155670 RepID=UPI003420FBAD
MARPVIAISGSADPEREYRKHLHRLDLAPEVCRELGRELAEAGWDLLVFSEQEGFVEPSVVAGYRT